MLQERTQGQIDATFRRILADCIIKSDVILRCMFTGSITHTITTVPCLSTLPQINVFQRSEAA